MNQIIFTYIIVLKLKTANANDNLNYIQSNELAQPDINANQTEYLINKLFYLLFRVYRSILFVKQIATPTGA